MDTMTEDTTAHDTRADHQVQAWSHEPPDTDPIDYPPTGPVRIDDGRRPLPVALQSLLILVGAGAVAVLSYAATAGPHPAPGAPPAGSTPRTTQATTATLPPPPPQVVTTTVTAPPPPPAARVPEEPPTAVPHGSADEFFLAAVQQQGIEIVNPAQAIAFGHSICDVLDNGHHPTTMAVAWVEQAQHPEATVKQMEGVVLAANSNYCPQVRTP